MSAVDWEAVAKDFDYGSAAEMFEVLRGLFSRGALAGRFGVRVEDLPPEARPLRLTLASARRIQKEGFRTAAKRLGVSPRNLEHAVKELMVELARRLDAATREED